MDVKSIILGDFAAAITNVAAAHLGIVANTS
jgi:hypothetical protein